MKNKYVGGLAGLAFLTVGFALAVLLLLGITGGFIVGTLALMVIIPAMTALVITNTLENRRRAKAQGVTHERVVAEAESETVAAPLIARVIAARGMCPMGHEYQVGEMWTLNGKAEGAHTLCPVAEAKLLEAGKKIRGDGEATEKVICEAENYQVVIELAKGKAGAATR